MYASILHAARPKVIPVRAKVSDFGACYHECKMSPTSNSVANPLGKSAEELRAFLQELGEPGYRGAQIYHALYAERRFDFAAMTNLPAALRERLSREAAIGVPRIVRRYLSSDGTVRYVLALATARRGWKAGDD